MYTIYVSVLTEKKNTEKCQDDYFILTNRFLSHLKKYCKRREVKKKLFWKGRENYFFRIGKGKKNLLKGSDFSPK